MKKIPFLFTFLLLACLGSNAQDTLVFKDGTRMACRIKKILDESVEFVKWEKQQGPIYTALHDELKKIIFEKGVYEFSEQKSKTAAAKKIKPYNQSIKTDLFAPLFHKITLGYEYVFESGYAFELYAGFISGDILRGSPRVSYASDVDISGYHFKAGIKIPMGDKDKNLLEGFFMRFDLLGSNSKLRNIYSNLEFLPNNGVTFQLGRVNVEQYGISYGIGYQCVFENRLTFALQGGIGYMNTAEKFVHTYPVSMYAGSLGKYDEYDPWYYENKSLTNALTFSFMAPVYFTGNISLGYAFGGKK